MMMWRRMKKRRRKRRSRRSVCVRFTTQPEYPESHVSCPEPFFLASFYWTYVKTLSSFFVLSFSLTMTQNISKVKPVPTRPPHTRLFRLPHALHTHGSSFPPHALYTHGSSFPYTLYSLLYPFRLASERSGLQNLYKTVVV